MKKILAVALASLICSMAAFEALAFEPETVEASGEKAELSKTETDLAADSIDGFAYEDATYGTLIYYNSFEGSSYNDAAYVSDVLTGSVPQLSTANAAGSISVVSDPENDVNHVLKASRTAGALFGVQFSARDENNAYINFATKHGEYTIVADLYVPDIDPTVYLAGTIWYPSWSHSGSSYRLGSTTAGTWSKNHACGTHTVSF